MADPAKAGKEGPLGDSAILGAPQLATCLLGLTRLALGGSLHSGEAIVPPRAQREAEARAAAPAKVVASVPAGGADGAALF